MSDNIHFNQLSIEDPMHDAVERWYQANVAPVQRSRQIQWDFYNSMPMPVPTQELPQQHTDNRFLDLPHELQDQVYEAASAEEDESIMRFVSLHQAVRHNANCVAATCHCKALKPNYITFHPLLRSSIRLPEWRALWQATNRLTRDSIISHVNRQSHAAVHRLRRLDPFPHEQGDWSLTQISQTDRNGTIVGNPYNCTSKDLIFVHVPPVSSILPIYSSVGNVHRVVTFDPLLEQIKCIALSIDNWDDLAFDTGLEMIYTRMDLQHIWQLTEEQGLGNVLKGHFPSEWPPKEVRDSNIWVPNLPQRQLRQNPNAVVPAGGGANQAAPVFDHWRQNMRVITDTFPALEEMYFVDFDLLADHTDFRALDRYRNTYCRDEDYCEECQYAHPGFPRVWGGLEEIEFIEVRVCACAEGAEPLYPDLSHWDGVRWMIRQGWPARDVNGNAWIRHVPALKLVAPIFRWRPSS